MTALDLNATVGRLVAERPSRARLFERLGIDYCCGGRVPFARACRARGLDPRSVVRELEVLDARDHEAETDDYVPATMTQLVDFIVSTHHAFLRRELPRLLAMAVKVDQAHGEKHPELREVRGVLAGLAAA